jgi:hypothetical protein
VIEGIDGKRLAGFAARDEIVEIAVSVGGPDLLDDRGGFLAGNVWTILRTIFLDNERKIRVRSPA